MEWLDLRSVINNIHKIQMKMLIIIILVLVFLIIFPMETNSTYTGNQLQPQQQPRRFPVYIDPSTIYLNEPILYSEWPQAPLEISSSL